MYFLSVIAPTLFEWRVYITFQRPVAAFVFVLFLFENGTLHLNSSVYLSFIHLVKHFFSGFISAVLLFLFSNQTCFNELKE